MGTTGAHTPSCFRGCDFPATAPASRFSDNRDGTVTDTATGLQWKRCSEGQTWSGGTCTSAATTRTCQQALPLADGARYAGLSDWRLPNIKELASTLEQAFYDPAIDVTVFPRTASSWFWSSTAGADGAERSGRPLAELLHADGTLNLNSGYRGSIDGSGYRLVSGAGEAPRFVEAEVAAGDAGWQPGIG